MAKLAGVPACFFAIPGTPPSPKVAPPELDASELLSPQRAPSEAFSFWPLDFGEEDEPRGSDKLPSVFASGHQADLAMLDKCYTPNIFAWKVSAGDVGVHDDVSELQLRCAARLRAREQELRQRELDDLWCLQRREMEEAAAFVEDFDGRHLLGLRRASAGPPAAACGAGAEESRPAQPRAVASTAVPESLEPVKQGQLGKPEVSRSRSSSGSAGPLPPAVRRASVPRPVAPPAAAVHLRSAEAEPLEEPLEAEPGMPGSVLMPDTCAWKELHGAALPRRSSSSLRCGGVCDEVDALPPMPPPATVEAEGAVPRGAASAQPDGAKARSRSGGAGPLPPGLRHAAARLRPALGPQVAQTRTTSAAEYLNELLEANPHGYAAAVRHLAAAAGCGLAPSFARGRGCWPTSLPTG